MAKKKIDKITERKIEKKKVVQQAKNKFADPVKFPKESWWVLAIVFVFAMAIYGNTIPFGYAFDDTISVTGNKFTIQGVAGIPDILSYDFFAGYYGKDMNMVAGGRWRPLSLVTFALEYQIFGENPHISHFINILLYALTGWLIFLILSYFFRNPEEKRWFRSVPLFAALLFVAHPIHTEVVANIKGRDEILTLLFSLYALWMSLKYAGSGKMKYLVYSGIIFFLGLLSKENAITFLAIIPFSIYFFTEANWKINLKTLWPLLIASVVFLIIRQNVLGESNDELVNDVMNNPFVEMSLAQKFATIMYTLGLYIKLLFFPHPLTYDYYPYHIPIVNWTELKAIIPLLIYIGMAVWVIRSWKTKSPVAYTILFFVAGISIVSNLFFPVGVFMNERFVYLPSVAFCMLIAYWLFDRLPVLFKRDTFKFALPVLVVVLALFSFKTIDRNKDWESSFKLFTTDVKVSGDSAKGNALAGEYLMGAAGEAKDDSVKAEYFRQAIGYLERAIEIYPMHGQALFNLVTCYYHYNRNYDGILRVFKHILKEKPYETRVFQTLNTMFQDLQDPDYKITAYTELDKLSPNNSEIYLRLGRLYLLDKKDARQALTYLEKSAKLSPNNAETQNSLGVARYQSGDIEGSLKAFEVAIQITPNDKQILNNLVVLNQNLGYAAKAEEYKKRLERLK
ncbi:MAG: tetratricopeptide repeat protein [Bacteroidales bacterium]|nr:tetratricopeptide repeat protein [Bacteroidales bacterium]MCF8459023.1 tetratricopeptide repeat protein [Bacteroidales bacterium]